MSWWFVQKEMTFLWKQLEVGSSDLSGVRGRLRLVWYTDRYRQQYLLNTLSERMTDLDGNVKLKRVAEASCDYSSDHASSHGGPFFRDAQFSPDGTSIITLDSEQSLKTWILSPDLLDDPSKRQQLKSYSTYKAPSNIQSHVAYPGFNLRDPSSTLVLHSCTEQPLTLRNALDYSIVAAKYNIISPTTEAYLKVNSLAFCSDGLRFVAGSNNQLSTFDVNQSFSGPISTYKLSPRREARKLNGEENLSCRGIVTALDFGPQYGILAAGTTQREVGLYADQGDGDCMAAFSVAPPPSERDVIRGTGVMHLKWTPNGQYLLVAERQSDCLQVWDVRNMVHRVSWLSGRKTETTQRMGIIVDPTTDGCNVVAGGTDGYVRTWRNPGQTEGKQEPDEVLKMHDGKLVRPL